MDIDKIQKDNKKWFNSLVSSRDGWICKKCGSKKELSAYHITPKKKLPKPGNSIYNGIILCLDCRKKAKEGKDENYYPVVLYALIDSSKEKTIEDLKPFSIDNLNKRKIKK